jgi:hypothetical protein
VVLAAVGVETILWQLAQAMNQTLHLTNALIVAVAVVLVILAAQVRQVVEQVVVYRNHLLAVQDILAVLNNTLLIMVDLL